MKEAKKPLIIITSIFVAIVIGWFSLFNIISPNTSVEQPKPVVEILTTVDLTLNYGEGITDSYVVDVSQNFSVFDVLQKVAEENNITLETEQYDFGVFVKSINGFESTAEMSWIYFVNGESGQVAADQYTLQEGSKVEWKYIKPE